MVGTIVCVTMVDIQFGSADVAAADDKAAAAATAATDRMVKMNATWRCVMSGMMRMMLV